MLRYQVLTLVNNTKEKISEKINAVKVFTVKSKEALLDVRDRVRHEASYIKYRLGCEASYLKERINYEYSNLLWDVDNQKFNFKRNICKEFSNLQQIVSEGRFDYGDPDGPIALTGYFRDGKTKIDLVVVTKNVGGCSTEQRALKRYMTGAIKMGLKVEIEAGRMPEHQHLLFIKVNAPNHLIERYGYIFHHSRHFTGFHMDMLGHYFRKIKKKLPLVTMNHERAYLQIIRENYPGPSHYSTLERSRIVYDILSNASFDHLPGDGQLLKLSAVMDAYALHDGPYFLLQSGCCFCLSNARQILFEFWTGFGNIFRMQPLHIIHEYYGEKIGMFFAFYGMYNLTMLIIGVVGIFVSVFNLLTWQESDATKTICASRSNPYDHIRYWGLIMPKPSNYRNNIWICSQCKHFRICPHRFLQNFCHESKYIDVIETNERLFVLPFFCFLTSLVFISCWKRKERFLLWFWEVDVGYVKNLLRSSCAGINKQLEFSFNYRLWKFFWNIVQLCICILLALMMLHYLLQYRYSLLQNYSIIKDLGRRKYVVTMILGVIHMVLVAVMERISNVVITYMLQLEEIDTYDAKDKAWAWRMFSVSFIFTFILVVYTAFIKGQFYTTPTDITYIDFMGGILMENCDPLTCMDEVCILATAVVVMKELVFKFIPYIRCFGFTSDYSLNYKYNDWPFWEREKKMFNDLDTERFLQQKYKEIVMQFASSTLFIGMWPLAPALAFITSAIDLRYCARRLLVATRRPLLRKSEGIGSWQPILLLIVFLMGMCYILMAVVTSDTILRLYRSLPTDTLVYDHVDFNRSRYSFTGFTVINGYPPDIDKQIKIGHIPLVLFHEVDFLKTDSRNNWMRKQYSKYVQVNDFFSVICQWDTPRIWPPILGLNCKHAYQLTPYRHCYFRGFVKRYATFRPSFGNFMNMLASQDGTTSTEFFSVTSGYWLWTTKKVYVFGKELVISAPAWQTTHENKKKLWDMVPWRYTVQFFYDHYDLYGYAFNWQARQVNMAKWYYVAMCTGLMCIIMVLVYFCWPDESATVTEGRAHERPFIDNYFCQRGCKKTV